jgi:hypothetical protein
MVFWHSLFSKDDPNFLAAAKESADKAVTCGVEINFECSNYAINLKPSVGDSVKVRKAECARLFAFTSGNIL